jgi:hypothetical protein
MLAKDAIEISVREGQASREVHQKIYILVREAIDVDPISTANASGAGSEVKKLRSDSRLQKSPYFSRLESHSVSHPKANEVKIPSGDRQKTMAKDGQE